MLPFHYMFLILMLSSSVIAKPKGRQKVGESKLLLHNKDVRLSDGLWTEVKISAPGTTAEWPKARYLDHVLQLLPEGTSGVEKVNLTRLWRKFMPIERKRFGIHRADLKRNAYRVVRDSYVPYNLRPAKTLPMLDILHIDECRSYLDDTYWGRNSAILGDVSDSLMIRESRLHVLLCALQNKSGPKTDWEGIMRIQWMFVPRKNVEAPYVTFISAEQLGMKHVLKAAEDYILLDDQEIRKAQAGYVWPAERQPVYYQQDDKSELLLDNKDVRLPDGLWARVEASTPGTGASWADLDNVIRFKNGTSSGIEKADLYKINRALMPKEQAGRPRKYHVVRTHHGLTKIDFQEGFPIEAGDHSKSYQYLHNTYWGRIPEMVGWVILLL